MCIVSKNCVELKKQLALVLCCLPVLYVCRSSRTWVNPVFQHSKLPISECMYVTVSQYKAKAAAQVKQA